MHLPGLPTPAQHFIRLCVEIAMRTANLNEAPSISSGISVVSFESRIPLYEHSETRLDIVVADVKPLPSSHSTSFAIKAE